MSLEARALIAFLLMLGAIAGWWRLTAHYEAIGYSNAQSEYQAAAELQREGNRGRAVKAETKLAGKTQTQDKFFAAASKELQHESEPLASCPVPADAVRLLNSAASCARDDRPASCGDDAQVPDAR